jgi:hypothetical protein
MEHPVWISGTRLGWDTEPEWGIWLRLWRTGYCEGSVGLYRFAVWSRSERNAPRQMLLSFLVCSSARSMYLTMFCSSPGFERVR